MGQNFRPSELGLGRPVQPKNGSFFYWTGFFLLLLLLLLLGTKPQNLNTPLFSLCRRAPFAQAPSLSPQPLPLSLFVRPLSAQLQLTPPLCFSSLDLIPCGQPQLPEEKGGDGSSQKLPSITHPCDATTAIAAAIAPSRETDNTSA